MNRTHQTKEEYIRIMSIMKRFHQLMTGVLIASLTLAAIGCSMMEEDRSDCPTGLYVRFVYDYNTQRADMFKDHVGYVNVYVYDEDGHKVAERSVANTNGDAPLSMYGYAMHFGTNELPTGRRYRLQAIAMQRQWDETLHTPGAKYRRTEVNDTASLRITLDYASTTISGSVASGLHPVDNTAPLDTLWHTLKVTALAPTYGRQSPSMAATEKPYSIYPLEEQMVTVNEGYATYATLSLIRDTKHLNLTIFQTDNPSEMDADDYEVGITDDNATLTSDNSVEQGDSLLYTPYAQWTSAPGTNEAMGHYNIMFNRIMYPTADKPSAQLYIRHKSTGKTVVKIDLARYLAECRISPLWNYSPQEYLDREYDYELNFFLQGDKWKYCSIVIHAMPWSVRKQNEEL